MEWNFLDIVLEELDLQMYVICVIFGDDQRKTKGKFCRFLGLRQGDQLSPYLFTLERGRLSRMVDRP